MGRLTDWIMHRAGVVGLSWPDGVADASGVARSTLDSITTTDNLHRIGRSARGYVARTLKVSVRDLESLAAARLSWIADDRITDIDRFSPAVGTFAFTSPLAVASTSSHGVPILGRVLESGIVEHFDPWTSEDGPRLSIRYPGIPDAFSLRLSGAVPPYCAGICLVFQVIPPAEFREGELGLLSGAHADVPAALFRVSHKPPMSLRLLPAMEGGERSVIVETIDVVRAARVIGAHEQ